MLFQRPLLRAPPLLVRVDDLVQQYSRRSQQPKAGGDSKSDPHHIHDQLAVLFRQLELDHQQHEHHQEQLPDLVSGYPCDVLELEHCLHEP